MPRADGGSGSPSFTYGLFDVTTNPVTLNQTFGNNPNTTIYNDLGSGVQYGQYVLSTATGPAFQLSLNQAGLNAISLAHQSHLPYFSIGGALINPPAGDNQDLFGSSGGNVVTLTVASSKLCKV